MILVYLLIAVVFAFIYYSYVKNRGNDSEGGLSELYSDENEYDRAVKESGSQAFEEKYFERVRNGEDFQQFLVIGGQQDCGLIRSLLAADGIPSYTENENVNSMYGGTPASVTGVFAIKLYILVNDYEEAYEIVCDYVKSKKETFDSAEKKPVAEVAGAVVTGLFFAPFPVNSEQKGMGITILPKKTK